MATGTRQPAAVPKNYLMLIAGLVWAVAGVMVMAVGIPLLARAAPDAPWLSLGTVIVFLVFYLAIFSPLAGRHTDRVRQLAQTHRPFWEFFDAKSYLIMAIMMGGGMWLRLGHVVPEWFIALFYPGLGFALFAAGTRFLSVFAHKRVLADGQQG